MAPGIISEGGHLPDDLKVQHPVAVMAEGKKHAMAIGVMSMSSVEVNELKKG